MVNIIQAQDRFYHRDTQPNFEKGEKALKTILNEVIKKSNNPKLKYLISNPKLVGPFNINDSEPKLIRDELSSKITDLEITGKVYTGINIAGLLPKHQNSLILGFKRIYEIDEDTKKKFEAEFPLISRTHSFLKVGPFEPTYVRIVNVKPKYREPFENNMKEILKNNIYTANLEIR